MWCARTHHCILTIIQGLLNFYFPIFVHIMWPQQRGCLRHLLSIYFSTNNQLPRVPFFCSYGILRRNRVFIYSFLCSPCFYLPRNQMVCNHICHICCTCPFFSFFINHSVIEPSIKDIVFLVFCFRRTIFPKPTDFFLEVLVCHFRDIVLHAGIERAVIFRLLLPLCKRRIMWYRLRNWDYLRVIPYIWSNLNYREYKDMTSLFI